jgi:hypothetical protein
MGNAQLADSFIKTNLRRLSTQFGTSISSESKAEKKKSLEKERGYDKFIHKRCK